MKILHITTHTFGGAGIACMRLHKSLVKLGVDSKVLALKSEIEDSNVIQFPDYNLFRKALSKFFFIKRLKRHNQQKLFAKMRKKNGENFFFSFPESDYDISSHYLVKEADIIHLHWIAGFVDYSTFFSKIHKPIIWTFHDYNVFLGGLHQPMLGDIDNITLGEESRIRELKKTVFDQINQLYIICISTAIKKCFDSKLIFPYAYKQIIHNGIESSVFTVKDKVKSRELLNLPINKSILLFVSQELFNFNKGLQQLLDAYEKMKDDDICLVLVGSSDNSNSLNSTKQIIHIPFVENCIKLANIYSAADLFILPSSYETFAQTPIESIMCGTPVVMTPVSGADDLVNEFNGVIATGFDSLSIQMAIETALSKQFNRDLIREDAKSRFDIDFIATRIKTLYNRVYDQNN